jgi:N-glycosidase YbiA
MPRESRSGASRAADVDESGYVDNAEHYFQAQKFKGTEHVGAILRAASPMVAARMGRSRQLLETGDACIVEHTARDRYWADGGDGSGRNMLGRLLMRVHDELR